MGVYREIKKNLIKNLNGYVMIQKIIVKLVTI